MPREDNVMEKVLVVQPEKTQQQTASAIAFYDANETLVNCDEVTQHLEDIKFSKKDLSLAFQTAILYEFMDYLALICGKKDDGSLDYIATALRDCSLSLFLVNLFIGEPSPEIPEKHSSVLSINTYKGLIKMANMKLKQAEIIPDIGGSYLGTSLSSDGLLEYCDLKGITSSLNFSTPDISIAFYIETQTKYEAMMNTYEKFKKLATNHPSVFTPIAGYIKVTGKKDLEHLKKYFNDYKPKNGILMDPDDVRLSNGREVLDMFRAYSL